MFEETVSESELEQWRYEAVVMTDLQFETMVRARIIHMFNHLPNRDQLNESYLTARFAYTMSGDNDRNWTVVVGSTYSDTVEARGGVLLTTGQSAYNAYTAQGNNKYSKLLSHSVK